MSKTCWTPESRVESTVWASIVCKVQQVLVLVEERSVSWSHPIERRNFSGSYQGLGGHGLEGSNFCLESSMHRQSKDNEKRVVWGSKNGHGVGGRPTSPPQQQGRSRKVGLGLETEGELVGAHRADKVDTLIKYSLRPSIWVLFWPRKCFNI